MTNKVEADDLSQRIDTPQIKPKKRKQPGEVDAESSRSGEDSLEIGVSADINKILNPEQMLAERREKVERMRALYAKGELKSAATEELAQAVLDGFNDEVDNLKLASGE